MQIIYGLYLSVVEGWSIIFSVQSSHEFCVQDAYLLFRFSQKKYTPKATMDILFLQLSNRNTRTKLGYAYVSALEIFMEWFCFN